jgi:hypothetical protein
MSLTACHATPHAHAHTHGTAVVVGGTRTRAWHAFILFSTSQYGRMKSNHISRINVWSSSNLVQILNAQQLYTVEFY